MIKVTWEIVVLLLGVVGFSLAAVCFTVWTLSPTHRTVWRQEDADAAITKTWPRQKGD